MRRVSKNRWPAKQKREGQLPKRNRQRARPRPSRSRQAQPPRTLQRWKRGRNCWRKRLRIMRGCPKRRTRERQKRPRRGDKRKEFTERSHRRATTEKRTWTTF